MVVRDSSGNSDSDDGDGKEGGGGGKGTYWRMASYFSVVKVAANMLLSVCHLPLTCVIMGCIAKEKGKE